MTKRVMLITCTLKAPHKKNKHIVTHVIPQTYTLQAGKLWVSNDNSKKK